MDSRWAAVPDGQRGVWDRDAERHGEYKRGHSEGRNTRLLIEITTRGVNVSQTRRALSDTPEKSEHFLTMKLMRKPNVLFSNDLIRFCFTAICIFTFIFIFSRCERPSAAHLLRGPAERSCQRAANIKIKRFFECP